MGVIDHFHGHLRKPGQSRPAASTLPAAADERLRRESWFKHLLSRPEFAALAGTVMVFAVFALGAGDSGMFNLDGIMNWSQVAAYLRVLAVGACLLMIAGEFDLSIGSMIGFAGMMVALPTMYFHWPIELAILFAGSMALGALNGYLVMRTRLPSFIVTLAFLFILRGLTLALSVMFADRTIISGVGDVAAQSAFAHTLFQGPSRRSARSRWRRRVSAIGSSRWAAMPTLRRTSACPCGA
jgi:simple sugar transport system permease protein